MATAKQFTEKILISDKLIAGNFAPTKSTPVSDLLLKDHLPVEMPLDAAITSDAVASEVTAVDQPLLMAKADIEFLSVSESAGAVVSDADVTYTDHITSVSEAVSDQPELLAMNTVQHISDSVVLAEENAAGGGIPWMWMGAAAVAGGGLGLAFGSNSGGNDAAVPSAAPVDPTVHVVVERNGAFIDADADGVYDEGEAEVTGFQEDGNAWLEDPAHPVVIHFNDMPLVALNLSGFTGDDKIQFDVASLQNNRIFDTSLDLLNRVSIRDNPYTKLILKNSTTYQAISLYGYKSYISKVDDFNGENYSDNYGMRVCVSQTIYGTINPTGHKNGVIAYWSDDGNALNVRESVIPSYNASGVNAPAVIANLNDPDATHGLVEFVWPSDIAVVVESDKAYIDTNNDGIHEVGAAVADFGQGDNADLAANHVQIHYNAVPTAPLNLSGFGNDDLIQIDHNAIYHDQISEKLSVQKTMQQFTKVWADKHGIFTKQTRYAVFSHVTFAGASYVALGPLSLGQFTSGGGGFVTSDVYGGVLAIGLDNALVQEIARNQVDFVNHPLT